MLEKKSKVSRIFRYTSLAYSHWQIPGFTNLNCAPPIGLDTNAAITLSFLLGSATVTTLGASTIYDCFVHTQKGVVYAKARVLVQYYLLFFFQISIYCTIAACLPSSGHLKE